MAAKIATPRTTLGQIRFTLNEEMAGVRESNSAFEVGRIIRRLSFRIEGGISPALDINPGLRPGFFRLQAFLVFGPNHLRLRLR
jgi:hypothetical protein